MPAQGKPVDDELEESSESSDESGALKAEDIDNFFEMALPPVPLSSEEALAASRKYVAYTVKLPSEQLAALQSIWLELKRAYGTHSPDKSGMIQQAITHWLRRWDGPEKAKLLQELLEIRQDTRRRQYKK